MGRRKRRGRAGDSAASATARRHRSAPPSWRHRAREVLARLRAFARERQGEAIEAWLRERFPESQGAPVPADLERAFDDLVGAPGSAGAEGRSLARAFAEEAEDLLPEERQVLPRWEAERRRVVWLLERAWPEALALWDPLAGERVSLQLLDRLEPARAAGLPRGTVVIAVVAPWVGDRTVALGAIELWQDEQAVALYRREVRTSGRPWHEMPAPAPGR